MLSKITSEKFAIFDKSFTFICSYDISYTLFIFQNSINKIVSAALDLFPNLSFQKFSATSNFRWSNYFLYEKISSQNKNAIFD